jgi:hypothetical protein
VWTRASSSAAAPSRAGAISRLATACKAAGVISAAGLRSNQAAGVISAGGPRSSLLVRPIEATAAGLAAWAAVVRRRGISAIAARAAARDRQVAAAVRARVVEVAAAVVAVAVAVAVAADAAAGAPKQQTFASPDEAVKALMAAVKAHDEKTMLAVLGPGAKGVINSGDPVADRTGREKFAAACDETSKLELHGDAKAFLAVGKDAWPFPIPVVKSGNAWRFDAKLGAEELLNRRIGRNELSAIQAAQAYVDAQREYYLANPAKDKLLQYAQKFVSTKGKRDGLYYPTREGEPQSPLGERYAGAKAAGYKPGEGGKPVPYFGYHYRILTGQGPDAPGGAYSYLAHGKMIGGFALIAYPATYGNSGIMTFIVNQDGVVYEKDLGPNTAAAAQKITRFNPDKTWKKH